MKTTGSRSEGAGGGIVVTLATALMLAAVSNNRNTLANAEYALDLLFYSGDNDTCSYLHASSHLLGFMGES